MNNNILLGILVVIIIVGGGVWMVSAGAFGTGAATSTPQTAVDTTDTTTTHTPAAPIVTTGTLVVASNSTAIITGKIYPNGTQTTYWYEYGRTADLGSRTTTQNVGSGYANTNAPGFLTGLAADTNYSFRLVAQNDSGTVSGAVISFVTNNNPPAVGSAPTLQTDIATSITQTSASLAGHVNPNGADTSYWFEYGNSSSLGNTTGFRSVGAGNSVVNEAVLVSNLALGTKYYYRIDAQNQFGTVIGSTLSFTTAGNTVGRAPAADTTAATGLTNNSATLNGIVNPNGQATMYWFEYSDDVLLSHLLGTTTRTNVANSGTDPVNVSALLPTLDNNATYSYRLMAQSATGITGGDIITFKTKR